MNGTIKFDSFILFFLCFAYSNTIKADQPQANYQTPLPTIDLPESIATCTKKEFIQKIIKEMQHVENKTLREMAPQERERFNNLLASLILLSSHDELLETESSNHEK